MGRQLSLEDPRTEIKWLRDSRPNMATILTLTSPASFSIHAAKRRCNVSRGLKDVVQVVVFVGASGPVHQHSAPPSHVSVRQCNRPKGYKPP